MSFVLTFSVSIDFILVFFSEIFSSKLNYFPSWNWTVFPLDLSPSPQIILFYGISWLVYSITLSVIMLINQLMFHISPNSLSLSVSSWVIILFVGLSHSASIYISSSSGYIFFNRYSPIFVFIFPPLKHLWSNHEPGNWENSSS